MKKLNILLILSIFTLLSVKTFAEKVETKLPEKKITQNVKELGNVLTKVKDNLVKENVPTVLTPNQKPTSLDLKEVFFASPVVYCILFVMSIISLSILLYTLITFKHKDLMSQATVEEIKSYLLNENFEEALSYCENKKNLLSAMIASGITTRKHGAIFMMETIKSEGKRATSSIWRRITLLNDIVVIAPMLGLLGTVIGMFYAFYDINRSIDSISALFDGLGIAIGTTVAGLSVAILSMIFHSILKFRVVKSLNLVENEAICLGNLIKTKD
jgi:biopolymer transport protein ExbB